MSEEVSTSVDDAWFMSAKQGRDDDLSELVKKVKDVNMKDTSGNTALHYSAHANHAACVKILIAAKADVNAKNRVDETPLHKAAWKGAEQAVNVLVEAGADLNAKNKDGQTPKQVCTNPSVSVLLEPVAERLWDDDDDEEEQRKSSDEEREDD